LKQRCGGGVRNALRVYMGQRISVAGTIMDYKIW
jgi:hypothetical protein